MSPRPRVALAGIHGYGRVHLRNIERLAAAGVLELVAVADPTPPERPFVDPTVQVFDSLPDLLADVPIDVAVVSTPIHTHAALAEAALDAGADVLLEKPPVTSLAALEQLRSAVASSGRVCQVGFQTLGSTAVADLREAIARGTFGDIHGISAVGCWRRRTAYWTRSAWSGRRTLGTERVLDGAVTNPFAHALITALAIDGSSAIDSIVSVEADLYSANAIEADDTSSVVVTTVRGTRIAAGLTLCATADAEPRLVVQGSNGHAELLYARDVLTLTSASGESRTSTGQRVDLLENLIAHRAHGAALIAGLEQAGAFTRVAETIAASEPTRIDSRLTQRVIEGRHTYVVVPGVEHWAERAAFEFATFKQVGAPWAT